MTSPSVSSSNSTNIPPPDIRPPDIQPSSENDLSILEHDASMPIAVVGLGFRGPGDATDVERLWDMIRDRREAWSRIPKTRWNNNAFYHPDHCRHGTINVEGGHFFQEDIALFDAPFFNMTSDEAAAMDPQQRLLLEVTYEGLENAGIPLSTVTGSNTSCFVGCFNADYTDLLLRDPDCVPMYQCTNSGQSRAMTANRISYFFDLKGPSVTVDTACSGSLVALHLACQSLRTGDASIAIAAGVNVILSHEFMSTMTMMKFLSPEGRCRSFDENADGYARGEGIGCLILKPLRDAIQDRDPIRAIIRGSGSNQDGRTPGITLPNGPSQEALIRHVYRTAGLDPRDTAFVEAHGTGTQAGDPIETGALAKVFRPSRDPQQPLYIGSIKANVGHLEGTSGIAGVIKAVLMLERRMFLPNRNFNTLNPRILIKEWNMKVQLDCEPWETSGPHRVSVNSFGYGGSNAHVILEDALGYLTQRNLVGMALLPQSSIASKSSENQFSKIPRIFMLSAFDETSITNQIQRLRNFLEEKQCPTNDDWIDNLAFTLNERRTLQLYRVALICDSISSLRDALSAPVKITKAPRRPVLGFVFTGQGAQWPGMGKELLDTYPVFRQSIQNIDTYMNQIGAPFHIIDEILKPEAISRLSHPLLSQPICSALQIALVDLLASWGIYPDSVTGHSSGEVAAVYATGVLSMEDAISIAYFRGVAATRLSESNLHKGAMLAVGMSATEIEPYINGLKSGRATVACINSPASVTISGDDSAIEELEKLLQHNQVFFRRLAVEVAYHSHHMELIGGEYLESISHIRTKTPDRNDYHHTPGPVPFFSSVTGSELDSSELGPQYWVRNLLGQVKFVGSLQALCFGTSGPRTTNGLSDKRRTKRPSAARKVSVDTLIEIGPHSALSGPIKQILQADSKLERASIAYSSALIRKANATSTTLALAAYLGCIGYPINFQAVNRPFHTQEPHVLVDLPPYSWNHTRAYWAEPRVSKVFRNRRFPRTDLLGVSDRFSCPLEPRWRNFIRVSEIPWLRDHRIQSNIVYPAAGYIAMAIEAAGQLALYTNEASKATAFYLRDVVIKSALVISESSAAEIMISLKQCIRESSPADQLSEFRIYSVTGDDRWTEHCKGYVGTQYSDPVLQGIDYSQLKIPSSLSVLDVQQFYEKLANVGLEYGPYFANLTHAQFANDTCFSEMIIPDTAAAMPVAYQYPCVIHPSTLDTIIHTVFVTNDLVDTPAVPVQIDEIIVAHSFPREPRSQIEVCTRTSIKRGDEIIASITAGTQEGPALSITGLRCKYIGHKSSKSTRKQTKRIAYNLEWKPDPDLLTEDGLIQLLSPNHSKNGMDIDQDEPLEEHAYHYIQKAKTFQHDSNFERLQETQRRILDRLIQAASKYQAVNSTCPSGRTFTELVVQEHSSPREQLLYMAGQPLLHILTGEPSTSIFHESSSWEEYLDSLYMSSIYQKAASCLKLMSHKNPMMSILELEAGEGHASFMFLQSLTDAGDSLTRCGRYTLTNPGSGKHQDVPPKLAPWGEWTDFKNLDIEKDLASQGFSRGSYDVVIVPNGLYSVESVDDALINIYALLRPGGHLVMINPISGGGNLSDAVIFSGLPEARMKVIEYSMSDLETSLKKAHFPRSTTITGDEGFVMILPKEVKESKRCSTDILIINQDSDCEECVPHLQNLLQSGPCSVQVTDIYNANVVGKICVVLHELKSSLLTHVQATTMSKLKQIFQEASGILWVTKGSVMTATNPDTSLITGFARTARSESGVDPIVTLDLDCENPVNPQRAAEIIHDLLRSRFFTAPPRNVDCEYAERNGVIFIPRVVEDLHSNNLLASFHEPCTKSDKLFHQPTRPLYASIETTEARFMEGDVLEGLPDDHVRISVHAVTLSHAGMGCAWSGVVQAVGKEVHDFAIGDRVACLGVETVSSMYQTRATRFRRITEQTSFEHAAATSVTHSMAEYAIHYLAHMNSTDNVLIYSAAGVIGQAISEICRLMDARIFAVVDSENDKSIAMSVLPDSQVLINRNGGFVKELMERTKGKGMDVIINCHTGSSATLQVLWKCAGASSRLIQICNAETSSKPRWEIPNLQSGVVFATISQDTLWNLKPSLLLEIWNRVGNLLWEGKIHGSLPVSFRISDISKALESLNSEDQAEFIVLTAQADDIVQIIHPKRADSLLRPDVSYLLVGGLGGIGRATALWMADHGAKSLVFMNRSGLNKASSKATVQELEEKGVQAFVRAVDIADSSRIESIMDELTQVAPPIRGVIQAAMVLRDIHIEKMTLDDYHCVLQPKYSGTCNLHRYLPKELDWFIMLSSISGIIGNATQAAYAAGSTFMDAFAAYRNSLGLHAVSIDLGVITDAGYLAENTELAAKMTEQGFQGTETKTVMGLIELAMTLKPHKNASQSSQIITGLGTWKEGRSLPNFDAPLFAHFRRRFQTLIEGSQSNSLNTLREDLKAAKSLDEASGLIYAALSAKIAAHLSVPIETISPDNPITEYGIDSHVAVDLRNWILKTTDSTVPILEILASGSMVELAAKIASKSSLVSVEA